jgi:hypothetical protein
LFSFISWRPSLIWCLKLGNDERRGVFFTFWPTQKPEWAPYAANKFRCFNHKQKSLSIFSINVLKWFKISWIHKSKDKMFIWITMDHVASS